MTNLYNAYHAVSAFTRYRLLLLLFCVFTTFAAHAQNNLHMVPISLDERVQAADMVVEGEVISQKSFWDTRHERIYTSNIIKVYKVFKGKAQEDLVEVITDGGTVGLDKHVYSVALKLHPGEQGVFFLQRQDKLVSTPGKAYISTRPFASEQAFIAYEPRTYSAEGVFEQYASIEQVYDAITRRTGTTYKTINANQHLQQAKTKQTEQQQNVQAAVITSFSPRTASAGTKTVLTINGTGFGNQRGTAFVSFRNADDGGRSFTKAPEDAYISWTNTQIKMYIPSTGADGGTAGTGEIRITSADGTVASSVDRLTIIFAYSNLYEKGKTYQPALIDENGEGGYTIHFAPSMQARSQAQEGFRRAMNSWICATNINWQIGAPTTKEASNMDDMTVIMFASASEVGDGVLARTLSQYRGCELTSTGEIYWWLSEFDMEINNNISWQYGPGPPGPTQFDFETVMLHELGHAHQLGHVILASEAIMHFELEVKRAFRDLNSADIEGGEFIMNQSQQLVVSVCRQSPIVPKKDGECNLASEVASLEASYTAAGDVLVAWETNTETGISQYIVERSPDGVNFEAVGTVAASAANEFTDQDPLPRTSYYRLQVVYTDGSTKYTFRVRVTDPAFLYKFEVGPNPVGPDEVFTVQFQVNRNTPVQLYLYDTAGRVVRNFTITFTDANLPLEFDMQGLAAGMYILKWSFAGGSGTTRVLKL